MLRIRYIGSISIHRIEVGIKRLAIGFDSPGTSRLVCYLFIRMSLVHIEHLIFCLDSRFCCRKHSHATFDTVSHKAYLINMSCLKSLLRIHTIKLYLLIEMIEEGLNPAVLHELQHRLIVILPLWSRLIEIHNHIILHRTQLIFSLLSPSHHLRRLIVCITLTDSSTESPILFRIMPISTSENFISSFKLNFDLRKLRILSLSSLIGLCCFRSPLINIGESLTPVVDKELLKLFIIHLRMRTSRDSLENPEIIIVHLLYRLEAIMNGIVIPSLHIGSG